MQFQVTDNLARMHARTRIVNFLLYLLFVIKNLFAFRLRKSIQELTNSKTELENSALNVLFII